MVVGEGISDGTLATTYTLIYAFLRARSHDKAAAAVKKAAKDVVVLREDVEVEGATLDEIVAKWKADKEKKTESSSDSSSDSDSSDISSDSSSDISNSSSVSDCSSSDSPSSSESVKPGLNVKKTAVTASNNHAEKKTKAVKKKDGKKDANSSSSGSDSSSKSDSDSPGKNNTNLGSSTLESETSQATVDRSKPKTIDVQVPVSTRVAGRPTKKRRTSEHGSNVATAVATETPSPAPNRPGKVNGGLRKSNTPFQRIKVDEVMFRDERLKNNAFDAKGGPAGDYGARANQDLIVTRGDGFRKEKNKKKRGSYRGGEITLESHSIKFT